MYVVYLAVIAVICALLNWMFTDATFFATLLAWLLGIQVGLGALWAFLGHYYRSDETAAYIGWRPGSPFQKEIAFANLALGGCGVLAFGLRHSPIRDGFWLATILFATLFLVGAFTVHAADLRVGGNKKPGNAGPVFFADIIMPVVLWVLYWLR
jgi:heme A synthase